MTLQLSVGKVRVGFQYGVDRRGRRTTTFRVIDAEVEPNPVMLEGKAICAKQDVFHKSVGRLLALRNALNPYSELTNKPNRAFDNWMDLKKEDRTAIYKWYWDNHRFDYDAKGRARA